MRDLLYKNLTSGDKRRKVIACSEIADNQGIRSIIHRHFIYIVKEVSDANIEKPEQYMYVRKERNSREHIEKFFCRIKGSLFIVHSGKLYLVKFAHSLKIRLAAIGESSMKYCAENDADLG